MQSVQKNLRLLAETISSIVTHMKPAVICCCEVGTAMSPMTMEQMSAMADAMREAWEEAATERLLNHDGIRQSSLRSLQTWLGKSEF